MPKDPKVLKTLRERSPEIYQKLLGEYYSQGTERLIQSKEKCEIIKLMIEADKSQPKRLSIIRQIILTAPADGFNPVYISTDDEARDLEQVGYDTYKFIRDHPSEILGTLTLASPITQILAGLAAIWLGEPIKKILPPPEKLHAQLFRYRAQKALERFRSDPDYRETCRSHNIDLQSLDQWLESDPDKIDSSLASHYDELVKTHPEADQFISIMTGLAADIVPDRIGEIRDTSIENFTRAIKNEILTPLSTLKGLPPKSDVLHKIFTLIQSLKLQNIPKYYRSAKNAIHLSQLLLLSFDSGPDRQNSVKEKCRLANKSVDILYGFLRSMLAFSYGNPIQGIILLADTLNHALTPDQGESRDDPFMDLKKQLSDIQEALRSGFQKVISLEEEIIRIIGQISVEIKEAREEMRAFHRHFDLHIIQQCNERKRSSMQEHKFRDTMIELSTICESEPIDEVEYHQKLTKLYQYAIAYSTYGYEITLENERLLPDIISRQETISSLLQLISQNEIAKRYGFEFPFSCPLPDYAIWSQRALSFILAKLSAPHIKKPQYLKWFEDLIEQGKKIKKAIRSISNKIAIQGAAKKYSEACINLVQSIQQYIKDELADERDLLELAKALKIPPEWFLGNEEMLLKKDECILSSGDEDREWKEKDGNVDRTIGRLLRYLDSSSGPPYGHLRPSLYKGCQRSLMFFCNTIKEKEDISSILKREYYIPQAGYYTGRGRCQHYVQPQPQPLDVSFYHEYIPSPSGVDDGNKTILVFAKNMGFLEIHYPSKEYKKCPLQQGPVDISFHYRPIAYTIQEGSWAGLTVIGYLCLYIRSGALDLELDPLSVAASGANPSIPPGLIFFCNWQNALIRHQTSSPELKNINIDELVKKYHHSFFDFVRGEFANWQREKFIKKVKEDIINHIKRNEGRFADDLAQIKVHGIYLYALLLIHRACAHSSSEVLSTANSINLVQSPILSHEKELAVLFNIALSSKLGILDRLQKAKDSYLEILNGDYLPNLQVMLSTEEKNIAEWEKSNTDNSDILLIYVENERRWYIRSKNQDGTIQRQEVTPDSELRKKLTDDISQIQVDASLKRSVILQLGGSFKGYIAQWLDADDDMQKAKEQSLPLIDITLQLLEETRKTITGVFPIDGIPTTEEDCKNALDFLVRQQNELARSESTIPQWKIRLPTRKHPRYSLHCCIKETDCDSQEIIRKLQQEKNFCEFFARRPKIAETPLTPYLEIILAKLTPAGLLVLLKSQPNTDSAAFSASSSQSPRALPEPREHQPADPSRP